MSEFNREARYYVIKQKDMTEEKRFVLDHTLFGQGIPTRECVVVEADWPNYEETWESIQAVAESKPTVGQQRDEYRNHLAMIAEMTGNEGDIGAAWEAVNAIQEALAASEKREQALAAHQVDLVRELTACQAVLHSLSLGGEVTREYADDAKAVLKRTKEASLARRQAEAYVQHWDGACVRGRQALEAIKQLKARRAREAS